MLIPTSLAAYNFQMLVGVGLQAGDLLASYLPADLRASFLPGDLHAFCRPGGHDKAKMHDRPHDVQHFSYWLQVKSFLEVENPKTPEAEAEAGSASKEDKGKGPMKEDKGKGPMKEDKGKSPMKEAFWTHPPIICSSCHRCYGSSVGSGSSPSLTSNNTIHTDTVMPQLPNTRVATPETSTSGGSSRAPPLPMLPASGPSSDNGAGPSNRHMPRYSLASGHQGSAPEYSTQPEAYQGPAPRFSSPQVTNVCGRCRVLASSDDQFGYVLAFPDKEDYRGSWWYIKAPKRFQLSLLFPLTPLFPFPPLLRHRLLSKHLHKPRNPSEMCHYIFAVFNAWDFTAVEVIRHSRDGANAPVPLGWFPRCRCIIETICYRPASYNGTERIPPLPQSVPGAPMISPREPGGHASHVSDVADIYKDCAVHLYFASMDGKSNAKRFYDKNDKMHFNQMMELGLDVASLARRIGVSLAIMHWDARIDARGVEFYLFSTWISVKRQQLSPHGFLPGESLESLAQGRTSLRVRYFDQVNKLKMTEEGMELAVEAVKRSMYIPRPNQDLPIQKQTWNAFVSSYIAASDVILRQRGGRLRLPRVFIDKLMNESRHWRPPSWRGINSIPCVGMTSGSDD
ncbi:hypothetical protein THARTR1_01797 [Trichoderma harzianum]|uniref:DUF3669 domain-containing protein n=1 Tax=Trichoderma harzianum TaxID=5544 RepID=A0A2K0UKG6_TRIHA|nr:hypothetical protein THARTR1_01797 [Trichoderma harzianum]